MSSSRSKVRAFRITHTQNNLLNNAPYKGRANAIVRVLLQLYFNKNLRGIEVEALIKAEENSIIENQKENLLKFRQMLQVQGQEKRQEIKGQKERKNGNNSSRV
jgi:hypothetical protein